MRITKLLSSVSNALELFFALFCFCIRNRKFRTEINEVLSHHCPFTACWFFLKEKKVVDQFLQFQASVVLKATLLLSVSDNKARQNTHKKRLPRCLLLPALILLGIAFNFEHV